MGHPSDHTNFLSKRPVVHGVVYHTPLSRAGPLLFHLGLPSKPTKHNRDKWSKILDNQLPLYWSYSLVPINLSTNPDCWGLPGTLNLGLHPSICKNVHVSLLVKFDPQSDWIMDGIPVIWNNCSRALQTHLALNDGKQNATGKRDTRSHNTKQ